ncbi:MAG: hypothetical protein WCS87_08220 [Methylococcaceae bacterium]
MSGYVDFDLRKQIYLESKSMAGYAMAKGMLVPATAIKNIEAFEGLGFTEESESDFLKTQRKIDITALVETHDLLARLIEPALPLTILFLNRELATGSWLKFLGAVPLVRQLMASALIFLFIFVALMSSPLINLESLAADVLSADGIEQGARLIFYIGSAGLGASFAGLYKANHYISNGTFDPSYQSSYWIRFMLGLIAGLLLAILISEDSIETGKVLSKGVIRPLLAILGGFSADLLYTFLNRTLEMFKSLFLNGTQNILDAKAIEAKAKLASLEIDGRNQLAQSLIKMQQQIGTDASPEEIKQRIHDVLQDLMKPK